MERRTLILGAAGLGVTVACGGVGVPSESEVVTNARRRGRPDRDAGTEPDLTPDATPPKEPKGGKPTVEEPGSAPAQAATPRSDVAGAYLDLHDNVGGLERFAKLYIPTSYDGVTALPLVIGGHGGGGSPNRVAMDYGWKARCEAEGWIGLFPFSGLPGRTDSTDNVFFEHLLKRVTGEFSVDRKRVWGVGFSGGGHRQYAFAAEHSEWVVAIAACGSAIRHTDSPKNEDPVNTGALPVSVLHIHGVADTSIPFKGGRVKSKGDVDRRVLPVREGLRPWVMNINGVESPGARLPVGCPSDRGIRTVRWEGKGGHAVQLIADPKLGHTWPHAYAVQTISGFFKSVPARS